MKQRRVIGIGGVVWLWVAMQGAASASTPVIWESSSFHHFQNGTLKDVSLASQGELRLAPLLEPVFESNEPVLWCVATDSRGNVYAGSGNDGKLFRIDPSGRSRVFFDADELEIHSLAVDQNDHVFVATFPDGRVHRLTPEGQASVLFEPGRDSGSAGDRYIWALAVDRTGAVFAGTGEGGRIYKIDAGGRVQVFAETEETHVVSLAFYQDGSLLAGTDPNGRLYRISPSGDVSVLYDSPYREIRAIAVDRTGLIYVSALNEPRASRRQSGFQQQPTATVPSSAGDQGDSADVGVIEVTASANGGATTTFRPSATGSAVYQIRPDGVVQEWWRSRDEAVFALAFGDDGALLAGTGPQGLLYALHGREQRTTLAQLQESQITALTRTPSGRTLVASSNLGKLYRLGQKPAQTGTFESEVKDTGATSSWGRIRWNGVMPEGTSVRLYTRTGNTDTPDRTWSAWSAPYTSAMVDGEEITSPPARYIQWKAELSTKNNVSPVINTVSLAYLTQNIAPVIEQTTVYAPGVYLRETSGGDQAVDDLPPRIADQIGNRAGGARDRQSNMGIPAYRKGMRSVSVSAYDPNNDDLTYEIYFKGEHETQWKCLKDNLTTPSYTWDSETLPDGLYTLKVVASDAPSNPPNLALTAEMESEPFLVDNTAPRIEQIRSTRDGRQTVLTFTVQDAASPIYKVEYAIDGGMWRVIYPVDGVADSREEAFELRLDDLTPGEHTVAIRARDVANNTGTGKRVITMP